MTVRSRGHDTQAGMERIYWEFAEQAGEER